MRRLPAPGGVVVSYDMRIDNPRNPASAPSRSASWPICSPGLPVRARRVTLALPVSRRLVRVSWPAAAALERASLLLNARPLATLQRPDDESE